MEGPWTDFHLEAKILLVSHVWRIQIVSVIIRYRCCLLLFGGLTFCDSFVLLEKRPVRHQNYFQLVRNTPKRERTLATEIRWDPGKESKVGGWVLFLMTSETLNNPSQHSCSYKTFSATVHLVRNIWSCLAYSALDGSFTPLFAVIKGFHLTPQTTSWFLRISLQNTTPLPLLWAEKNFRIWVSNIFDLELEASKWRKKSIILERGRIGGYIL